MTAEKPVAKFQPGDIVDTPYDGRRRILRVWWYENKLTPGECWMYEIEPPQGNRYEYGRSYSEDYINEGLFIAPLSGLDLKEYKPTHPPTYQDSPCYQNSGEEGT